MSSSSSEIATTNTAEDTVMNLMTTTNEPLVLQEIGCSYLELIWLISKLPISSLEESEETGVHNKVERSDDIYRQSHQQQHRRVLPPEILRRIANWFTVDAVTPHEVQAVDCSSSDRRHPLRCCLQEDKSTWWISRFGSMPRGKGEQYVTFQLSTSPSSSSLSTTSTSAESASSATLTNTVESSTSTTTNSSTGTATNNTNDDNTSNNSNSIKRRQRQIVRLSKFSIEIPPLPMGPLSVRTLRLDCKRLNSNNSEDSASSSLSDSSSSANTTEWKTVSPIWTIENKTGWQTFDLPRPIDAEYVRVVCLSNQMSIFYNRDDDNIEDDALRQQLFRTYECVGYYHVKLE